ncbi:MAG: class I SAM-dependent methyltransferase [Deltaproteobacteria bacterium]|nr:class I SAM-dependent methyltransferase [Deltaproteobacteria bacterium]
MCRHLGVDRIQEYYGVDYSPKFIDVLKDEIPQGHFFCRDIDTDSLDFDGKKFDCILMAALIEHLHNQRHIMSEVTKALKPGGVVVMTTPPPFENDIVHHAGAKIGVFAASAMDDHIVIYNKHRFGINMVRDMGLDIALYETFQFGCNQLVVLQAPA